MAALDTRAVEPLYGLEQLRHPLAFPIGKLSLGDRVPKLRLLRLATLHVEEVDLADRDRHSIMTSAFSLVCSSSKKSLSPLSRRASTRWLEVRGADDRLIGDCDLVNLSCEGLERFFTGKVQTTEG